MHKVNICSHGVFLTWDLELSIQQSASMVTPEKPRGKARNASGRVETSLDDYGIPRDCVVGSPPSRLEDSRLYKYIQLTWHCPVTGPLWLRTMVTLHLCTESGNPIPIWVIVMALMVIKQCGFRFQSKGQESPAVSFSSHLEERQLKLCVEVKKNWEDMKIATETGKVFFGDIWILSMEYI